MPAHPLSYSNSFIPIEYKVELQNYFQLGNLLKRFSYWQAMQSGTTLLIYRNRALHIFVNCLLGKHPNPLERHLMVSATQSFRLLFLKQNMNFPDKLSGNINEFQLTAAFSEIKILAKSFRIVQNKVKIEQFNFQTYCGYHPAWL